MSLGLINISEANSIAIHLCIWLALEEGNFNSTKLIAKRLGFSHAHSAKVVQQLVHAGILETLRGAAGGARLARPAEEITLLDIIVATGSYTSTDGCMLKSEVCQNSPCVLRRKLSEHNEGLVELFKNKTLADVAHNTNVANLHNPDLSPKNQETLKYIS
ncbi:MAG: Rrf2 family transcriptional regulator [Lentisphaerae bacterium]|jgi:Rrf2 family nitric oxide-sensitive transcriptional repressor|nr:Rrf2 family transcriptional regulator [Lentisphaerota bacterium]